ncbi:MAG: efflux RND transporter permease subunit [Kofleriaceae bacterium]|nr:efflux RND transporter permease subunit [Kofleriaceae bacterium]
MQWLASISVRRPVFASVLILTLLVVGLIGYAGLGVDKFPKVDFPLVTITTIHPGAAPASVETDITDKIEAAVNTVAGLEELSSISTEGASLVIAQFTLEKDPNLAAQEVEQRVNAIVSQLPTGARKPQIAKADPDSAPVAVLAVLAPAGTPVREVTEVAEINVQRALERLDGVGQVTILGGQKRRINIQLDPIRLAAKRVSALEVYRAIGVANVSFPGGRIQQGPTQGNLRIEGKVALATDLARIVVRQQGDLPVRVGDVADVEDSEADAENAAITDGVRSVVLAVRKQSGRNTVQVVDNVKGAVGELGRALPPGYRVELVRDNSELIRTSADQVLEHLVVGAGLAVLVVLLFLGNLRSTVIAAVSIPVSIVSTFALMAWAGFTLNLMTLLALALAVGIVIDDAIVVLENIYRYIDEKGMRPFPAAIAATKEIGLAVLSTTLSLMAVFLPVAFMSGIVGRFLMGFGLTMAFAILVSMFVSFTLTPMMAARWLPPPPPAGEHRRKSWLERAADAFNRPLASGYHRLMAWSLRHRWVVVVACIGACASVPVVMPKVGNGFLPKNDEAQFEVFVRTPEGTTLDATTVYTERLARQVRALPEVEHTVTSIADTAQKQSNVGKIYVRLVEPDRRTRPQEEIMDYVRKHVLVGLPEGTRAGVQLINDFNAAGGQDFWVQYMITGPDLDRLELYAKQVMDKMRPVPGVVDLDSSITDPVPETTLRPNLDRAAMLGVDPGDITSTLALLVGGIDASTYEDRGRQYDIHLRAAERFRDDPSALALLSVPSRTLGQVPLSDVVDQSPTTGPSQIGRNRRTRSVFIQCNIAPGFNEGAITAAMSKAIAELGLPPTYRAEPFGRSKEAAKVGKAFGMAIGLAFLFMYLVLAAQFESWLHPITIMMALPLTFPFALISLLIFGQQLDIFTMLGLLVLFGMVKKNSILQVDLANQLRARGLPRDEAVLEASRERLRPILMTTFAFVAGMLPLVFSNGVGAGFSKAMAGIVVGGQTLSLLLTLVAIPITYTLLDDLRAFAGRQVRRVWPKVVDRGAADVGA